MKLPVYVIDAFTDRPFHGNPAAVCPLPRWLPDATLQSIAAEHNLAETAFFVPRGEEFDLRWFTPALEIDLCGHATVASAFALHRVMGDRRERWTFHSKSGPLQVSRDGEWFALDFPARPPAPCAAPPALARALGATPLEVGKGVRDLLARFASEADVRALRPDFAALATVETIGVIATAPGESADFVSRFFAPRAGINEDPVTGSSHWSRQLGKKRLEARQISARGGELRCEDRGERVSIAGRAVLYLEGTIEVAAE
jgi:PhzF family phenazine biosynthesis protein